MRIIAGDKRSIRIRSNSSNETRPTSDKIKGAIFSSIGQYFERGIMLDLFSGSGNMSFEALSRGMHKSIMGDNNPDAIKIIKDNIKALNYEGQCTLIYGAYQKVLEHCISELLKFDLIYLDPPYALDDIDEIIKIIDQQQMLKEHGYCIVESSSKRILPNELDNITIVKAKIYGKIKISYYKRKEVKI